MQQLLEQLKQQLPLFLKQHEQKLNEKMGTLFQTLLDRDNVAMSREEIQDRIRQEVGLYGLRMDVAEELERLETHFSEARHILQKGGSVGKRLDFLMQELNREANTLGSKANAIEQTRAAMELKVVIEQMREQVQNLE